LLCASRARIELTGLPRRIGHHVDIALTSPAGLPACDLASLWLRLDL
jgi:hypothetical protein